MSYINPGSQTAAQGTWLPPGVGPGSVTSNGVTNQNGSAFLASDFTIPGNGSQVGVIALNNNPPGTYLVLAQATFSGATNAGEIDMWIYCNGPSKNFGAATLSLVPGQSQQLELTTIIPLQVVSNMQLAVQIAAAVTGNVTAVSKNALQGGVAVTGLSAVRIA